MEMQVIRKSMFSIGFDWQAYRKTGKDSGMKLARHQPVAL
jgi:hypothetical protein